MKKLTFVENVVILIVLLTIGTVIMSGMNYWMDKLPCGMVYDVIDLFGTAFLAWGILTGIFFSCLVHNWANGEI